MGFKRIGRWLDWFFDALIFVLIVIIVLFLLVKFCLADDTPFRLARAAYHVTAFLDYSTTFHCSCQRGRGGEWLFLEKNPVTRLYWRSEPAFCAFKMAETVILDVFFRFVYKKSRFLGYLAVFVFTAVRIWAFRDNLTNMRVLR